MVGRRGPSQARAGPPLVELIAGARRTLGIIRGSILFSLAHNAVAAGLAPGRSFDRSAAAAGDAP